MWGPLIMSTLCKDCEYEDYADTLQCELCWEDICQKEKCSNSSGYTCKGCETTWCDDCLEEVLHCDFCEKCTKCDPNIYACDGCEDDVSIMEGSLPFVSCTQCRLDMGWTMSTKFRNGDIIVCCPKHPHGSPFVHDPLPESAFPPLKLHKALMV